MRGRMSGFLLATALVASACQTPALYDKSSIVAMPVARGYADDDAFIRDAIVYLFPRACLYYLTSDGVRSSDNMSPDRFSLISIAENANKDGWYRAIISVTNFRGGGSPMFYFSKNDAGLSCGGNTYRTKKPVDFVTGRYLDLERLGPVKLASATAGSGAASPQPDRRSSAKPSWAPTAAEVARESNDYRVCGIALKLDDSGWDPAEGVREYVREAERRNLTPAACAKIVRQ